MKRSKSEVNTLLFFGSFDPFTLGHAYVVDSGLAWIQPKLGVEIVPAWKPVWEKKLSPFALRREIIETTIRDNPTWQNRVFCNSVEEEQQLSGRTLDTLNWLSEHKKQQYSLLMGSDSLKVFSKWHAWKEIVERVDLYVVPRFGDISEELTLRLPEFSAYFGKEIIILDTGIDAPGRFISSTEVRNEIKMGKEINSLSPGALKLIRAKHWYGA